MRALALVLLTILMAACSSAGGDRAVSERAVAGLQTGGPSTATDVRADALPAQDLQPGDCGIFLFERRPPNAFVLFESEADRSVQILHEGRLYVLRVPPQRGVFLEGETFRRVYLDERNNITFTLNGEVGAETGSGPRLQDVILSVRTLDGGRVVRPLGGVRSCRDATAG